MLNQKPLISIGMPLYNEERYLEKTIQSLLAQEYDNFEIIISDNASTDEFPQEILTTIEDKKIKIMEPKIGDKKFKIILDGVFFQINNTGIARIWVSLLQEWVKDGFADHIIVLDRANTMPKIPGINYRTIPAYNYNQTNKDRQILQQICDEENANLFISTYYTTPLITPSVLMVYDMIPEVMDYNLNEAMWREKHYGIKHASKFITISHNTAKDLVKFFPEVSNYPITVAPCGINPIFTPANSTEIEQFKLKYQIKKPYFLLVGSRSSCQNYKNAILFFQALSQLKNRANFEVVCVGGEPEIHPHFQALLPELKIHLLRLSDDELRLAYSGAVALVYPSKYEGFGLPVLEAMASGCPVITCRNSSIPEVAGEAAIYVDENDILGLATELLNVLQPKIRENLIQAGLQQAKKFSWSKMAQIVKEILLKTPGEKPDNRKILVVTSIAPGNVNNQQNSLKSWQKLGLNVVSLNTPNEISELQSIYPHVKFHPVTRDASQEVGRPLIYVDDLLQYLRENGQEICGIINSDICLKVDENFSNFIKNEAKQSLVIASRIDVNSPENTSGELYNKGYDFFFFDQQLLDNFPKSNFCLGIPWWDFWFPLMAMQKGVKCKLLKTPIAYHVKHFVNYSNDLWQKYGMKFIEFALSGDRVQNLAHKYQTNSPELQRELINVANQFLNTVEQNMQSISYYNQQQKSTMLAKFPAILPQSATTNRPFWSVMIPTFNKVEYLAQTLRSILEQAPSSDQMQIEVINDHPDTAKQTEIAAIVQQVGRGRIQFYSHSQIDIGQTAIFNLCIERSLGEWVHILHDDDVVLPGFYQTLQTGIQGANNPAIGAAFCRHFYIDEKGNQISISQIERDTAGIIENWLERIAISQRIQPSSIVVKRTTYENLGGFYAQARSASDWEMWQRIATAYAVWYEPQILASYRLHSLSWSSRLLETGGNIDDTREAIKIAETYLPSQSTELTKKALEHYAYYAINTAKQMEKAGNFSGLIAQIKAGLKCSQSDQIKNEVIKLFTTPEASKIESKLDGQNFLNEILEAISRLQQEPNNQNIINQLRQARQKLANFWVNHSLEHLETIYLGDIGKAHQALLSSLLRDLPLTDVEKTIINQITAPISQGLNTPKGVLHFLAMTLYLYAHQLPEKWYEGAPIPNWLISDYIKFTLTPPNYFKEVGEADQYYYYLKNWIDYLHHRIFTNQDSPIWHNIATLVSQIANFILVYFNSFNMKDLYIKRAEIMEFAMQVRGAKIDWNFPARSADRTKIRLGILSSHFLPQTETFCALPFFEYLDRNKFEIILYANNISNHPLEEYCRSRADKLVELPKDLTSQVNLIRNDDLDILLMGTNLTAITRHTTLLAIHRLARITINSTSSCVTSGMRNIDYYISGSLTEPKEGSQDQYTEKLVTVNGPAHCFNYYAIPQQQPTIKPDRKKWGVTDDHIVFISGANFYKVTPELKENWAKILAAVPNSILVLYPFNPNWTRIYQSGMPWVNSIRETFQKYGVESKRLVVIKTLPSRVDIKECLKLADVYLDSYPFSGVNSLVDPLEVGLPVVTRNGNSFRSLMGPALLKSIALDDLIAPDESGYIQLAAHLAKNEDLRQEYRTKIQLKMMQNPPFLDSRAYSQQIGNLLQNVWHEWVNQARENPAQIAEDNSVLSLQFINRAIGSANLYDIDPTSESIIAELRQIRRQLADFWMQTPPDQLQSLYQSNFGNAYQAVLRCGIQNQALTDTEKTFLQELTQISKGLVQPQAINAFLSGMLYFTPGTMRVPNAETRLPKWLFSDYAEVFEQGVKDHITTPQNQAAPNSNDQFIKQVEEWVKLYQQNPRNQGAIEPLFGLRRQIADFILTIAENQLETIYQKEISSLYKLLLNSGLNEQPLTATETEFFRELVTNVGQGMDAPKALHYLLAIMLYCRPGQLQVQDAEHSLPPWLLRDYQQFNL